MRGWLLMVVIAASGCKMSEERFIDAFTEADCTYRLECTSEPVLAFNGWDSLEACMDDIGPQVAADVSGCDANTDFTRACVKAIEDQACSGSDDREYPAVCASVFDGCDGGSDPDTGADTDPGTDSDTGA